MKLYEAKNIITEVFENPFDKDKFSYFIRNLLKNLHPAEFLRTGYNIPKAFQGFIASYERLGKYEDEEGNLIDVLIVKLKRDHSIDYARSTQRNFVRWYLNDKGKDAALVAFHTEKSSEWRFSFIKMQYSLEKKKDELTPAKRSSFMVGESVKSHTAQRQLIDLLKNDHAPKLSDIEQGFSIEAVSDEFYEKYKTLLFNLVDEIEKIVNKDTTLKEEFENKNISIINFSKKLLGQIVFLYFLQKKGWLGLDDNDKYGEGDKNFLRTLFNKTKPGENFFNDYLEYLFYDALSKPRTTDFYPKFKTRIPFLNGGLFDPIGFYDWQKTDIVIPNQIFSFRKGDDEEGSGILDVFDLYNFTVKEDEPLETEVAIDPEMLGKVFERMLEVTERKSKGAFYTPREIVHYMAQQSLLYFLETELNQTVSYNKLGDNQSQIFGNDGIKGQLGLLTENKACAVPKADLETFIHYGEHIIDKDIAIEEGKLKQTANKQTIPESIRRHADAIDQALENIKICDPAVGSGAFPVGIMNEIVKLRKLLTPFLKNESANERSAYRFKSNAIQNSIYGVDIDAGAVEIAKLRLWLSMVVDEERIDTIEPLPNLEYKIVQGNSLINMPDGTTINDALATEIEKLTSAYFYITDKEKKQEQKQIIDNKIQEQLDFVSKMVGYEIDFDFKLFFYEVWHKKDGFDIVIGNPPYVNIYSIGDKEKKIYKSIFSTAFKKFDLYVLFFEKGIQILGNQCNINYISSNKYFSQPYGLKLRELFLRNKIIELVNFRFNVFKATVDTAITQIAKDKQCNQIKIMDIKDEESFNDFLKFEKRVQLNLDFIKKIPENLFRIEVTEEDIAIIERIQTKSIEFSKVCYVNYGCRLVSKNGNKKKSDYVFENNNSGNLKAFIEGSDIRRYRILSNRYVDYKPGEHYLSLFPQLFENEKLVSKDVVGKDGISVAFDSFGYYDDHTTINAVKWIDLKNVSYSGVMRELTKDKINNSQKYSYFDLLGYINSQLSNYYFSKLFNIDLHFYPGTFQKMVVPLRTDNSIGIISNYIVFLKALPFENMSFYFEQLIDGMVYELYFENEIKKAGCDILKHLVDLPEINDEMSDDEKMSIITKVFNKLYDKESPVCKNLYFMDSVEEVAIIKNSIEK